MTQAHDFDHIRRKCVILGSIDSQYIQIFHACLFPLACYDMIIGNHRTPSVAILFSHFLY